MQANHYVEFQFLKSWQRLLVLAVFLFSVNVSRIAFLGQNNGGLIALIGISLVVIGFFTMMLRNKKIIITNEFITFENNFLGYRQQNFAKNQTQIDRQKILVFDVIKLKNHHKGIYVLPFFWGNNKGKNIGFYL